MISKERISITMRNDKIREMVKTALFIAVIYVLTYTFKIPVSITGGYTHMGDCAIFLSVILLGRKNGTVAGACGAALADLLGGYVFWVVPTFIIKGMMAFVMGTVIEKVLPKKKANWLIGACAGGILQIIGYTAVKVGMLGLKPALLTIPGITFQTAFGIVIAAVIIIVLIQTKTLQQLRKIERQ